MKGKKKFLARIGVMLEAFYHINPFGGSRLIVFNYHRICPDTPNFSSPFDDDVFRPTSSMLKEQLKWLKKRAKILSESELVEVVESGALLERNVLSLLSMMLTGIIMTLHIRY